MIPNKHGIWNLLALGVPLLAVGILISWMGFKAPPKEAGEKAAMQQPGRPKQPGTSSEQDLSGNDSMVETRPKPRTAAKPEVASGTASADIRFDVRAVAKMQPDATAGHELRSERRELSASIPDLFSADSPQAPESLLFPLFDGRFIELKELRHEPMGTEQGVVFAEADGEVEGGHALLSYVGTALAGMIHLPTRGEFYEIRTAPDGRSHILTQIDPDKMGVCGGCAQHLTK